MGSRAQLQGTPWHEEQIKRTCKHGSKYCIYNKNICVCTYSKYYHKKCVGKGTCDAFESKGGTPKISKSKTILNDSVINKTKPSVPIKKESKNMTNTNDVNQKESKEEKFLRISKNRIDKIEEAIGNLENLSDKYSYTYNEKQVEKMFSYLENRLEKAKDKFLNRNQDGFTW